MERVDDKKLQELRDAGIPIYSISRIDAMNGCQYSAYRTYVLGDRGNSSIWGYLGSQLHSCLEDIMNGKSTEDDLLPTMQKELDDMDMLNIEFPNEAIRNNWVNDITHFCTTYKAPEGHFETEKLFIYKTPAGHYLQGYIDLTKVHDETTISIYDYKTSSMYSKEDFINHGRQLLVYALGKMQEGYEVKNIAWIFLKYAEIRFMGKKTAKSKEKTLLSKVVERRKLADEMMKYVESDLVMAGYDEIDCEIILKDFKDKNSFDALPEGVRENYKIYPCVIKYDMTQELFDECNMYIDNTIERWEQLDKEDLTNFPPREFTRTQKNGKVVDDYFFCTSLCSHFKNCPYIKEFLDKKDNETNSDSDADLF